jgi:MATE family multidrug resistance protein
MAYRGFNVAVSRPKAVMVLQLGGLALKVPINALLVFGFALPTPFGTLALPALGAQGCGIATAIVMWCQLLAAIMVRARAIRSTRRSASATGLAPPSRRASPRCCAWASRWACRS